MAWEVGDARRIGRRRGREGRGGRAETNLTWVRARSWPESRMGLMLGECV